MIGALNGIKILDFSHALSGPFCTLLLRDLGAEVIKIEKPDKGDIARGRVPQTRANESGTFIMLNRGKKSITLNLKSEKGKNMCKELAKKVDVVVENFSTGTMEKLGLGSDVYLCFSISFWSHRPPQNGSRL
jgi:CoA:oxalate CoA-transferase